MAKDHDLDVVVQVVAGTPSESEHPADEQVQESEEHGPNLLPGRGPILRNALAASAIGSFRALHPRED